MTKTKLLRLMMLMCIALGIIPVQSAQTVVSSFTTPTNVSRHTATIHSVVTQSPSFNSSTRLVFAEAQQYDNHYDAVEFYAVLEYSLAPKGGLTNPLPENGVFSRVMPREYAEAFARGESGLAGGAEVFVGAADDLAGVTTRRAAATRLALFTDEAGTNLNLAGDVIVKFKIKDIQKVGLRSPTEFGKLRNYGFTPGGRTGGGAREWLINNGTKDELGIYDIVLEGLK